MRKEWFLIYLVGLLLLGCGNVESDNEAEQLPKVYRMEGKDGDTSTSDEVADETTEDVSTVVDDTTQDENSINNLDIEPTEFDKSLDPNAANIIFDTKYNANDDNFLIRWRSVNEAKLEKIYYSYDNKNWTLISFDSSSDSLLTKLPNSLDNTKVYIKIGFGGYDIDLKKYVYTYIKAQELAYAQEIVKIDNSSYIVGDTIKVTYDFSKVDYDIKYFYLKLIVGQENQSDYRYNAPSVTLYKYENTNDFKSQDTVEFKIPNKNQMISNKVFVEASIYPVGLASKEIMTDFFSIEQNQNIVPSNLFGSIENVFTTPYPFPSDTLTPKTSNSVFKSIIDDNGMVHMIISHSGEWFDSRHRFYREWKYYYMTYNPKDKSTSTPQLLFETSDKTGNLPSNKIDLFEVYNNVAYLIASDSANYEKKLYTIQDNQLNSSTISSSPEEFGYSRSLTSLNGNVYYIYTKYEVEYDDGDLLMRTPIANRVVKVYENANFDMPFNLSDIYKDTKFRFNGNQIFYYQLGEFYQVDSNMKIVESSKEEIGNQAVYLYGNNIRIYDDSVKTLLIDVQNNITILNNDTTKETLFQLSDSDDPTVYKRIVASVYADKVIVFYNIFQAGIGNQYKVAIFNRTTKTLENHILGNKVSDGTGIFANISINKNKEIVVANVDGDYETSAQLITGEVESDVVIDEEKSDKEALLSEVNEIKYAYFRDKLHQKWYITATNGRQTTVYSLKPIKDGKAGWAQVGQNVAIVDLETNKVSIGNINDNNDFSYYDAGWQEEVVDESIQKDIELIRNSTVDVEWWFFKASNGKWYIVNAKGAIHQFAIDEEKPNDYDWKDMGTTNLKPNFTLDEGAKSVKF